MLNVWYLNVADEAQPASQKNVVSFRRCKRERRVIFMLFKVNCPIKCKNCHWRPSLVGWRPSLLGCKTCLVKDVPVVLDHSIQFLPSLRAFPSGNSSADSRLHLVVLFEFGDLAGKRTKHTGIYKLSLSLSLSQAAGKT